LHNKTADVASSDNHELNALPMVDATAKTVADKGPVILVLRNCACHGLNRTPHSAGQIEWHMNKAWDTSVKVGGRQVIKTVEGHCVPVNVIRGLPCMQMEPNTAEEFNALPHVMLTQGGEWDPAVPDHMLTDDDDWVSKAKHNDDQECDSPFDNRGECKHREPIRAGVRLKNALRARCTLWGAAPLGHYVGYQKSTVQGNRTKACIIAPKWVQTVLQIICTTLATIVPRLHPFHLSNFFN